MLDVEIPVITPEERELLFELARSLNRYRNPLDKKKFEYKEQAVNDFNESFNIIDLFQKHDWEAVKEDDQKVYLRRAGSLAPHSGYYFKSDKVFYCFSTSTPFTAERPYNHFQVLQVLESKPDYNATLKLLPELGYPVSKKIRPNISSESIAEHLNSIGFRYDSFIQDLTYDGKIVVERVNNTMFLNLKKHFKVEIPRARFEEVANSSYITEFNPIQEYIEKNRHRQPSGTFKKWVDCLTLKNQNLDIEIVERFFTKWYVGLVAQALDGEFPNEFFLTILSVEQGIGKTTLLRKYTIPEELQKYRVEHSLSFDDDVKVLMGQALLIIDDEMDGRTYEMEKTFKTVLSIKELTTRRKYDRRISNIKRRCSFAGSGNNLHVVREQQNRRIIPIEVTKIDREKLSQIDLDDLFMEAYHLFKAGYIYSYQPEDKPLLNQLNEDYTQQSDVDLILDEYVDLPHNDNDGHDITNLDLVTTLLSLFPQFTKRINVPTIGKMMNDRGFVRKRVGKKKISTYVISSRSRIIELMRLEEEHAKNLPF